METALQERQPDKVLFRGFSLGFSYDGSSAIGLWPVIPAPMARTLADQAPDHVESADSL
jgi:hypothetical protein